MPTEKPIRERLAQLIQQGQELRLPAVHGQARSEQHIQECRGGIAGTLHVVSLATVGGSSKLYSDSAQQIFDNDWGWTLPNAVGELTELLIHLLADLDAGLLGSITDRARAETFDNFLDHGRAYLEQGSTREAGGPI